MKDSLRNLLTQSPRAWEWFRRHRAAKQEHDYQQRCCFYAALPSRNPQRSFPAVQRKLGDLHTLAVVPSWGWHGVLVDELKKLGHVSWFDYAQDLPYEKSATHDSSFLAWRTRANQALVHYVRKAHADRPIDWMFAYSQGDHLLSQSVRAIRDLGIPTVNMCLDDKQSWDCGMVGEQRAGSIGLVSAFDLWWSSASVATHWVDAEGGNGLYLPEGCVPSPSPCKEPYEIDVSFVGAAYGARRSMVNYLRKAGINVKTFGAGWPDGYVDGATMARVFRTSQISLGHGGIGYSDSMTNVKGRDFDIPALGAGLYLTTFNADLASHFDVGHEIACWHSYAELVDQLRYFLPRPELCREMAQRAWERCSREHSWSHRYHTVLKTIGITLAP